MLLDVSNMKCGGCSASVKRILLSKPGVEEAAVNLLTESAVIKLRPGHSSAGEAADLLTSKANHMHPFLGASCRRNSLDALHRPLARPQLHLLEVPAPKEVPRLSPR